MQKANDAKQMIDSNIVFVNVADGWWLPRQMQISQNSSDY